MTRRPRHIKQSAWRRRRTTCGAYPAPAGARGPMAVQPLPEAEAHRRLDRRPRALEASGTMLEGIEHEAGT